MSPSRKNEIIDQLQAIAAQRQQLDEQERALLAELEAEENRPTPPAFEPKKRMIQWQDGCQKLSPQRYKILDALHLAENHVLMLNDLERAVWGESADVNLGTIKTAVCRLGIELNDSGSPFFIESVLSKGGEPMEISDREGVRTVKTRPSLLGFRLISRVTESGQGLQNSA